MKHLPWLAALVTLVPAPPAQGPAPQAQDPEQLLALETVLARAIGRVQASIVTIETIGGARRRIGPEQQPDAPAGGAPRPRPPEKPDPPEGPEKPPPDDKKGIAPPGFLQAQGTSTGLVLSADGWIVTSSFVLNYEPSAIIVTLADGRAFQAQRAGEDTSRGLTLLKIDATGLAVPELVPRDDVRVGQWAFALGRTFGPRTPSVHGGIVSARDRLFGRAVQTDAWTSPANYGGPLIDVEGRVFGVITPLSLSGRDVGVEFYDSGIGFAAMLSGIEPLLARMRDGERLQRGFLGLAPDASDVGPGAKIAEVVPNAPAARAGLRKGDRLLAIDGVPVQHSFHLQLLVQSRMAGDPIHLRVRSGDEERAITVMLDAVPGSERSATTPDVDVAELPWEEERKER